jgi:serum/glucocorticoid-regulated kinase 2
MEQGTPADDFGFEDNV